MPRQSAVSIVNNFTKGLITEATGLNYPENACTETYDCTFDRLGKVSRRLGIDYEANASVPGVTKGSVAISQYKWSNAGGDGGTQVIVVQMGGILRFFRSSTATTASPLSTQILASTIDLSSHVASGGSLDETLECQYAEGNGYLFVFNPSCEPIYCTYSGGTITATSITVKTRDFEGVLETGVEDNTRALTLTNNHRYNLANQGWGKSWRSGSTSSMSISTGSKSLTIDLNFPIVVGDRVIIKHTTTPGDPATYLGNSMTGIVTAYTAGTGALTVLVATITGGGGPFVSWTVTPKPAYLDDWFTAIGNYPANSDVWWYFKNSSDVFSPSTQIESVTTASGPSPKGFYILDLFNQRRSTISGISGISDVTTTGRPRTGAWFAGRVWYSGVDVSGHTERLYFSQIIERTSQFGLCYQINDLTSEERFDLLPSDGGYIGIQGCGKIFKLFPIQNGLLVFAAHGIWFVTGSQGIGFTANDYTVTKISSIQSISGTSFVNIQGYPMFWNEEGIYSVTPNQQGQLAIQSMTDQTIADFYQDIPLTCKKFARGSFDPINNIIQWSYRNTEPANVTERFEYDRILNFNLQIGAFYPWTIGISTPKINGVVYIEGLGGANTPAAGFKYFTTAQISGTSYTMTFSEFRDTNFVDWDTHGTAVNYSSYFITGSKLRGEGIRKFQSNWLQIYVDNTVASEFDVQSRYDFAITGTLGRWSSRQRVSLTDIGNFSNLHRRLKLRGHGLAISIKISSVDTKDFNIIGWMTVDTGNANI